MNKYKRDLYHIRFFDKYGSHHGEVMFASGFNMAERIGETVKSEECDVNSYTILRVLKNSLDGAQWRRR